MTESRINTVPKFSRWGRRPLVTTDADGVHLTAGDSVFSRVRNLAPLIVLAPVIEAIADGRIHPGFTGALFVIYFVGLFVWERNVSDSLTLLSDEIVVEHHRFHRVSREVLRFDTVVRVEVGASLLLGYPLRFVRTNGTTGSALVLGVRRDHEAIAGWVNNVLQKS